MEERRLSRRFAGARCERGKRAAFLPWDSPADPRGGGIDIYFPVLHGPYGEDGTIQGLLEMADVPYVGAGVLGSAVGHGQGGHEDALPGACGSRTVEHVVLTEPEWRAGPAEALARIRAELRRPLFVKPANLGSSVGITKVAGFGGAAEAIERALLYDRKVVVEQGIRRPGDRMRRPGQRRPAGLPSGRGHPPQRILRLRRQVPRRQDALRHPGRPPGGGHPEDPEPRRAGVPGLRRGGDGPGRLLPRSRDSRASTSTRSTPSPASPRSACTPSCGR